ncbi:GHKL domain-containing protein [Vibrio sp. T187]|uniref:sensor histidine kinase n=1 Tax=Vibrio TaxID=662 RepID=UPI0010C94E23|nr:MULTISPECIES: HAMP domain-containing sensor histidine kinase [Vibrio]MBW3698223.1 GHKL domain-containing protein [Vibrio sp. T187]
MDMLILFSIYLIYGLAFFAIGFSIIFRNYQNSQISISKLLPTLAVFGFIHGIHEWSELYIELYEHEYSHSINIEVFKAVKLWVSFLALGAFGWKMIDLIELRWSKWLKAGLTLLMAMFVSSLFIRYQTQPFQQYIDTSAEHIRLLFGFGSGLLAGVTLIVYAKQFYDAGHGAASPFTYTGTAMIAYGVSAGILFSDLGIWVIFLRTGAAIAILVFLWRALRVFDIERERQIETALQNSYQDAKLKELGELTSAVAHEVKTPLSSALMSCDLLEAHLPNDENSSRQLLRIRHGIERAAHISQEVLSFAHHRKMNVQEITVNQLVESATSLIEYRLSDFSIEVHVPEHLSVQGDAVLLEEVLVNLLANAIDASQDTKSISILGYVNLNFVIVEITDSGTGVPDALLDKVIQPFFTTKGVGEGTGMGLAICRQILMQHHGELSLKNTERGLCVQIRLPKALQ